MKYKIGLLLGLSLSLAACQNHSVDDLPTMYNTIEYSEICLMNADGTNERAITNDRHRIMYANFLPNGEKIIFGDASYPQTVYSINLDGSGKTKLFSAEIFSSQSIQNMERERRILLTKDSKKIIYTEYYTYSLQLGYFYQDFKDVYSINLDGTNKINITQCNGASIINGFSLSNDERQILYTELSLDSLSNRICISNSDGTNKRIVKSFGATRPLYPQFLPSDNNIIVFFEMGQSESISLYRLSLSEPANVTKIANLTRSFPGYVQAPPISPSNMIFFSGLSYPWDVRSIDILTGGSISISTQYNSEVTLSNDGSSLVLGNGLFHNISVSALDGSGMRTFKSTIGDGVRTPILSPSKQQIIYRSFGSYQRPY